VKEFKYLSFIISNKGKYKEHFKEWRRKGMLIKRDMELRRKNMYERF